MDLAPTTFTAPSSLASSPVAPIYDAWRALAADFLTLGETIRSCPLDLVATSLGVPVWRTAWPDGVKAQVIAWYGQYGGQLYTRAGLAAFVWIFGGDLTTWGAITDYWETDPAGTPHTTAAVPSTPLAYSDDVVSSYIAEWTPLGRTLTLDSSAAVIPANYAIRRIIVTIPSSNLALVPLGTPVGVWSSVSGDIYDFRLVSLEPTDDPTVFTGIIVSVHHLFDGANDPAQLVSLGGDATAVMDTSIPDGILQPRYPAVATGDPVLTTGRAGWDAVVVSKHAELLVEVYINILSYVEEFLFGAVWTAAYASGDKVKFTVSSGEGDLDWREVQADVHGFTFAVKALHGGPLAGGWWDWVSFAPDAPWSSEVYDGMPDPVIVDVIAYGKTTTYPAIPAIPPLGTIIPLPPFAPPPPIPQTDAEYYKSAIQSVPNVAGAQVYITGNAVTIRPLMVPDYRVGDASTITAVENYFNAFGFALGSHVITCKNLNAKDTVLTFDVALNGVAQADFTTAANDVARAFLTDLGAQVCDAEGDSVYLYINALVGALDAATDADVSGVTGNVRFPAAAVAVVYTATGYTYAPNGLKVDNGVGIALTFNFEA